MKRIIIATLILVLYGCGGGGSDGGSAPANSPTGGGSSTPTGTAAQRSAISFAYNASYDVPAGFYEDPRAGSIVEHVMDTSPDGGDYRCVTPIPGLDNVNTDLIFFGENVYGYDLVGTGTDAFSFYQEGEFLREVVPGVVETVFLRLLRCDHLNRTSADTTLDGFGGVIGTAVIPGVYNVVVPTLFEYIYTYRDFGDENVKVLSTSTVDTGTTLNHTLEIVTVLPSTDGSCDTVTVGNWTYKAHPDTGEIEKTYVVVDSFDASNSSGTPTVCN